MRSFSVTARVRVSRQGADGVLLASGSRFGGWSFYVKGGKEVASGRIEKTILLIAPVGETFDIGRDTGLTVHSELEGDGAFTGQLEKVELELAPMNEMTQGGGKT